MDVPSFQRLDFEYNYYSTLNPRSISSSFFNLMALLLAHWSKVLRRDQTCQSTRLQARSALCRIFPEPHCTQGRCTTDREFACWCRRTYLVFMPSSIFEFRCAVHGSPSVIYHPTENLRIRSACSRLCYTEPSLLLFLLIPFKKGTALFV